MIITAPFKFPNHRRRLSASGAALRVACLRPVRVARRKTMPSACRWQSGRPLPSPHSCILAPMHPDWKIRIREDEAVRVDSARLLDLISGCYAALGLAENDAREAADVL